MKVLVDSRLFNHPKLLHLAKLLGRAPAEAAGYLACLWAWAAEYRLSGSLAALEARAICSASGWRGEARKFVAALRVSGWIDGKAESLQIHDWEEHQGKYIRKMLHERARKRRGRSAEDSADVPADTPRQKAPPGSVAVAVAGSVAGAVAVGGNNGSGIPHPDPSTDYQTRVKAMLAVKDYDPKLVAFLPETPTPEDRDSWDRVTAAVGEKERDRIVWALKGRGRPWRTTWVLEGVSQDKIDLSQSFPNRKREVIT